MHKIKINTSMMTSWVTVYGDRTVGRRKNNTGGHKRREPTVWDRQL